jgi:hypothetical protein
MLTLYTFVEHQDGFIRFLSKLEAVCSLFVKHRSVGLPFAFMGQQIGKEISFEC